MLAQFVYANRYWNRTAKHLLISVGLRNLTPKKIQDIGWSISTIHQAKHGLLQSLGIKRVYGMRNRHQINVADEKIIMKALKDAGFRGDSPSFGAADMGQFNTINPNVVGGVDVVSMKKSLARRCEHLADIQKVVYRNVHSSSHLTVNPWPDGNMIYFKSRACACEFSDYNNTVFTVLRLKERWTEYST